MANAAQYQRSVRAELREQITSHGVQPKGPLDCNFRFSFWEPSLPSPQGTAASAVSWRLQIGEEFDRNGLPFEFVHPTGVSNGLD